MLPSPLLNKLIVPPAVEPITVAEAKVHLRVLHASEDGLIARLIAAARQHAETTLNRAFVTQTWEMALSEFPRVPAIDFPRPPLASVTSITYVDVNGADQVLSAGEYHVVLEALIGFVRLKDGASWPTAARRPDAVRVRYVVGYGAAASAVPAPIVQALLLMVEHWYHMRSVTSEQAAQRVPFAADALLSPYQTFGWI